MSTVFLEGELCPSIQTIIRRNNVYTLWYLVSHRCPRESVDPGEPIFYSRSINNREERWTEREREKGKCDVFLYYGISSWMEENLTLKLDVADLAAREEELIWWLSIISRSNLSSIFFTNIWICATVCPIWPTLPSIRCTRERIVDFDRSSPMVGDGFPIVCSILIERRRSARRVSLD